MPSFWEEVKKDVKNRYGYLSNAGFNRMPWGRLRDASIQTILFAITAVPLFGLENKFTLAATIFTIDFFAFPYFKGILETMKKRRSQALEAKAQEEAIALQTLIERSQEPTKRFSQRSGNETFSTIYHLERFMGMDTKQAAQIALKATTEAAEERWSPPSPDELPSFIALLEKEEFFPDVRKTGIFPAPIIPISSTRRRSGEALHLNTDSTQQETPVQRNEKLV